MALEIKTYMRKTWIERKGDHYFGITSEKNIPEHKILKDNGFKLNTNNSSLYLENIDHTKELIDFLQEFVDIYSKGGEE